MCVHVSASAWCVCVCACFMRDYEKQREGKLRPINESHKEGIRASKLDCV